MKIQHNDEYESYYSFVDRSENLEHFGKFGMKWGIRRWQNKDGSLTPEGRIHYGIGQARKAGIVEKVRNAGIKKVFGEEKLNKQLDYERKQRAKKDVEKILYRDLRDRPEGSKASIPNFLLDRRDYGTETAINNFVREMAKEDLNKILNKDYLRYKKLPQNIADIVNEKVRDEKYQDYKDYLDQKFGPKEKKSLFDVLNN